jgi:hypothetical protein
MMVVLQAHVIDLGQPTHHFLRRFLATEDVTRDQALQDNPSSCTIT